MTPDDVNVTKGTEAEAFLAEEVLRTKKTLATTMIVAPLIVLVLAIYLGVVTAKFRSSFDPPEAAKIAKGLIAEKVNESGPDLAAYIKKEVPAAIEKVPDYVKGELPNYRVQLEEKLATEFENFSKSTSKQLDTALTQFLTEKQDDFKTVMLTGQDPQASKEIAAGVRQMFVEYLTNESDGQETIQQKLDAALESLGEIEKMTAKMVIGKNLTPEEAKTRRAIAVLLTTIDEKRQQDPLPTRDQMVNAGKELIANQ